MGVIGDWLNDLCGIIDDHRQVAEAVRVGVFYTAVQISGGYAGVAFTPRGLTDSVCCPRTAAAALRAGHIIGQEAWRLADYAFAESPLRRAIGIATLNTVSAAAISRRGVTGGRLHEGLDALEAAEVKPDDRFAMVGTFVPYVKALRGRVANLAIIDKHPEALKAQERPCWTPLAGSAQALSESNIAIISGSALVEGGIDDLLKAASSARRVIIAGPTTPLWGRPFFERGVYALAGISVRDSAQLLRVVAEAGSGYFFDQAARKVTVVAEGPHVRTQAA